MTTPAAGESRLSSQRSHAAMKRIIGTAGVLALAVAIALLGTGTSYALFTGRADVDASSVTAGTTGITVNGASNHLLTGLDLGKLGPGQSVFTATPITIANTGSTKLNVRVANVAIGSPGSLKDELAITVTPASTCAENQPNGWMGRLTAFSTPSALLQPAGMPGSSLQVCVQVTLDADAPVSVKNQAASFTLNLAADQVR